MTKCCEPESFVDHVAAKEAEATNLDADLLTLSCGLMSAFLTDSVGGFRTDGVSNYLLHMQWGNYFIKNLIWRIKGTNG
ncbi:PHD-finger [Musa troglodytarum]|uniref:PHD-finger n=1 Tax=Musa troglodytarum TaxID=320322 RepID=A0A9E7K5D4_9LILI|nr:PHD-finger [Musa troglodytarum]